MLFYFRTLLCLVRKCTSRNPRIRNELQLSSIRAILTVISKRTNLSPFTKDFRGITDQTSLTSFCRRSDPTYTYQPREILSLFFSLSPSRYIYVSFLLLCLEVKVALISTTRQNGIQCKLDHSSSYLINCHLKKGKMDTTRAIPGWSPTPVLSTLNAC